MDEVEKNQAGKLTPDPEQGTKVVQIDERRRREEEKRKADEPRILTVKQILDASAHRAKSKEKRQFCATGHVVLDDATGGIVPGDGWVFAAETNWGKSSWLVSVADVNLQDGKGILIVSAEDAEHIYGSRLLARRSGVMASRIRNQDLDPDDEAEIDMVLKRAENDPVYLDARGKTCEWVVKHVEKILDDPKNKIDIVAYDYIQEIPAARQEENHRLTVKKVARELRMPVKRRNKASIIVSQITVDEKTKTRSGAPNRNMIRDCRDIANAAEVILIGYTPEKAVTTKKGQVLVAADCRAIWVDKVKQGRKNFAVAMDWNEDTANFERVTDRSFDGSEAWYQKHPRQQRGAAQGMF